MMMGARRWARPARYPHRCLSDSYRTIHFFQAGWLRRNRSHNALADGYQAVGIKPFGVLSPQPRNCRDSGTLRLLCAPALDLQIPTPPLPSVLTCAAGIFFKAGWRSLARPLARPADQHQWTIPPAGMTTILTTGYFEGLKGVPAALDRADLPRRVWTWITAEFRCAFSSGRGRLHKTGCGRIPG